MGKSRASARGAAPSVSRPARVGAFVTALVCVAACGRTEGDVQIGVSGSPGAAGPPGAGESGGAGRPGGRDGSGGRDSGSPAGDGPGGLGGDGPEGSGGDGPEGSGGESGEEDCAPRALAAPQLVRRTFDQIGESLEHLLGPELAAPIRDEQSLHGDGHFPALLSPNEGPRFDRGLLERTAAVAGAAAATVLEHFESISDCGPAPDDTCVEEFLVRFAARAFRRPLADEERQNVLQVYGEAKTLGAGVALAASTATESIFHSPAFLYRTEFGEGRVEGADTLLAPYELADALAFFLTNRPPDDALLEAAATRTLLEPRVLEREVERMLASAAGREHLQRTLFNAFRAPRLDDIVVDSVLYPTFNPALRQSMREETWSFFGQRLAGAPVRDWLVTRRTRVNAALAGLYGVAFPPPGATVDSAGYAEVTLPETRSGILTQATFLSATSRPDRESLIGRGWWIHNLLVCGESIPEPPADLDILPDSGGTEREIAERRITNPECRGCHGVLDSYGLALDAFDAIGRARETAPFALKQPDLGVTVSSAAELGRAIADSGRFEACLVTSFLEATLGATASVSVDDCTVRSILGGGGAELDLTTLVGRVASSPAFSLRKEVTP